MRPDHLLETAAELADVSARRPRRTDLCRATSTVYYALFHCLARACADILAGAGGGGSRTAWRQVYRALEHGQTKRRCRHPAMREFPVAIRDFAETFVSLQDRRHLADYDPDTPFRKSEVQEDVQRARTALTRFAEASREHRRAFAIHVLMKVRTDA